MTTKHRIAIILLLAIYLAFLVRNSWASDDAFITLRVVRNLLHGYGLRWNGAESETSRSESWAEDPTSWLMTAACRSLSSTSVHRALTGWSEPARVRCGQVPG